VPQPAPSDLVVRGGVQRDPSGVLMRVQEAIEDGDGPVISVSVGTSAGPRPDALHRISKIGMIPHKQIQYSTVEALTAAGLQLVPEQGDGEAPNHYHVVFSQPLQLSQAQAFVECFVGPIPNPTGGYERK
jgi:hypothetical protein